MLPNKYHKTQISNNLYWQLGGMMQNHFGLPFYEVKVLLGMRFYSLYFAVWQLKFLETLLLA